MSGSADTDSSVQEVDDVTTKEVYFNDTLTSNITSLETEEIESLLPSEVTELDKILRAGKQFYKRNCGLLL